MTPRRALALALLALALTGAGPGRAQSASPEPAFKIQPVRGPAPVAIGDGLAQLEVPPGYLFLAKDDAIRVLKRAGNPVDGSEIGLLHPVGGVSRSFIVVEYAAVGHVADTDSLDPELLLSSITATQAQQNQARRARNQPEITVAGWAEPPTYDPATRRAAWAVKARAGKEELINSRTRLLGREGYLSFNLITEPAAFPHDKAVIADVLSRSAFMRGHRYEDFQPGKDRICDRTLTDLVVGGSAAGGLNLTRFREPLLNLLKIAAVLAICSIILFGRFRRRRVRAPGATH